MTPFLSQPDPGTDPHPHVERHDRGWHARLELPLLARACPTARRAATHLLTAWQVPDGDRRDDALLVVSELVGNAVRHGCERVALELDLEGPTLTVAVLDDAEGLPRQRGADESEESGRGIAIVAALTQDWGTEELPGGGKRVWARLPVQD